jgi:16S rRNA (guanine527-N7)-methyltransferase
LHADAGNQDTLTVRAAAQLLWLEYSEEQFQALATYRDLLVEANTRMNLTALKTAEAVEARLIAESLAIVPLIGAGPHRLLDVGTGGGIPGIPLAIALPDSEIHLLDATAKKLAVIAEIVRQLGLDNVRIVRGRAEEVAHEPEKRGCYTVVVARAVARLPTLVEYTLPFLRRGGVAIFPKGRQVEAELREAMNAIDTLGGRLIDIFESPISGARFVRVEQRRYSPARYPRKSGAPARQPIGVSTR